MESGTRTAINLFSPSRVSRSLDPSSCRRISFIFASGVSNNAALLEMLRFSSLACSLNVSCIRRPSLEAFAVRFMVGSKVHGLEFVR